MEASSKMVNYDWILKSIIGMLGTGLSVMLENVSASVSIVAGFLTCIYMIFQIMKAYDEKKERSE